MMKTVFMARVVGLFTLLVAGTVAVGRFRPTDGAQPKLCRRVSVYRRARGRLIFAMSTVVLIFALAGNPGPAGAGEEPTGQKCTTDGGWTWRPCTCLVIVEGEAICTIDDKDYACTGNGVFFDCTATPADRIPGRFHTPCPSLPATTHSAFAAFAPSTSETSSSRADGCEGGSHEPS